MKKYTRELTSDWPVCHVFLAKLAGQSYRCSAALDDADFDRLMDTLHWRMPYNLRAFHTSDPKWTAENPVLKVAPELPVDIDGLLAAPPLQPMRLKDKRRQQTLTVRYKHGNYVLADTEDGYGRLYCVDGIASSLVTRLEAVPITLQEASAYIDRHHRHNAGPKFHQFSVCLRVPGEPEPVGVAVADIPKARHQMDGVAKASAGGWNSPSRPRSTDQYPTGEKLRWVLYTSNSLLESNA